MIKLTRDAGAPGEHLRERLGRRLQHRQEVTGRVREWSLWTVRLACGPLASLLGAMSSVGKHASILHRVGSVLRRVRARGPRDLPDQGNDDREHGHGSNDPSPCCCHYPAKGRRSRSDGFDAPHLRRLPELPPTTSLHPKSSVMMTVIALDDQAGAQVALLSSNRNVRSSHLSYARPARLRQVRSDRVSA